MCTVDIFEERDTGAMWKHIKRVAEAKPASTFTKDYVRSRYHPLWVLLSCITYDLFTHTYPNVDPITRVLYLLGYKDDNCYSYQLGNLSSSIPLQSNTEISSSRLHSKREIIRAELQLVIGAIYGKISPNAMCNPLMERFFEENVPLLKKFP